MFTDFSQRKDWNVTKHRKTTLIARSLEFRTKLVFKMDLWMCLNGHVENSPTEECRRWRRRSTYKISGVPFPKCKTTLHNAARGSVCGSVVPPGPSHRLLFPCEAITTQLPSPTLSLDRCHPAIQRNQPVVLWLIARSNQAVVYLCVRDWWEAQAAPGNISLDHQRVRGTARPSLSDWSLHC